MDRIAALVGPTGGGKTALAVALSRKIPLEVISCDSQAVYRGLDIGTAKPGPEERAQVPHHLVDVVDPWEGMSAARWAERADAAIAEIRGRGRLPLVVGGTGLWLRALLRGISEAPGKDAVVRAELEERARTEGVAPLHAELARVDPVAASRIRPTDPVRVVRALEVFRVTGVPISTFHERHAGGAPRYDAVVLGVTPPRAELYERVDARAAAMFDGGLIPEAVELARDPRNQPRLAATMGYREALQVASGELDEDEARRRVSQEQRRYAKRQLTWFRAMPEVEWLPWPPDPDAVSDRLR